MYQNQHGAPPPASYPPAYSAYYPQQYDPNYQHSYYQYQQPPPPPPPFPPPPPPTPGSTIEHQPVPPPNPPQPPPPPPSEPPPPGTTEDVTPHQPPEPTEEDKKTEDMKIEGTNGSGGGPAQHEDETQRTPSDGGQTPTEENQWQAAVSQWMGQQAAASQWAGQQATSPQWAGQQTPSSQWAGQQTTSSQWAGQQTTASQWAGQQNTASQWAGYPSQWQATPQWPEQQWRGQWPEQPWRGQQWAGQQTTPSQWPGQQAAPQWPGQQTAPQWPGQQTAPQWAGQQAVPQWTGEQATQSQWAGQQATQSQWAGQQSSSQQAPGQASAEPQQTSGWQAQQATSTAKQQPADSQGQQDSSWQQGEQDSQQQQQQLSSTAWQVPQQPKEGGGGGGGGGTSWQGQQSGWQPSQPDAHSWQAGKDGSVSTGWQGSRQDTASWQAWQGAQGTAWQSHLAWQSAQSEHNATWQSSQSQSQQWPTSQPQSQQNTAWPTTQPQYSSAQPPQQGTTWQNSQLPQPQQSGGGSSNYSWGGHWPQWGGESWQANSSTQQWQKPGVEAWAGQPWGQQGGEGGGGKQHSYNYQQTNREAGLAGTSYQAPGVGYDTQNVEERPQQPSHQQPSHQQPSHQQPSPQQPSPQQRGGYNPLPSHRHREHDVPRYESGRGERTALLPTPPAPSPSDAPVDHKRLSYDDGSRGRKRKRPSRWESREEERVLPSADYRQYAAVPPPGQMPRLSQQPPLHSGRQEEEEEEDRTPPLSPLPPKQEQKEALDDPTRQWPPQLSSYISRAFDACSTDQERDRIHHFLQVELLEIFNENKQWSINWDTYPLPLDKGMEDRKSSSRWDTLSPSAETRWVPPELPPQQSPVGRSGDGGMEGGRGKRKRKRKRGKNRFFIDTQPSPDFVVSAEEQRRIDQRAHRFTSGAEGNRAIKKLSINDLIRPASSVNLGEEGEGGWQGCAVEGTSQALEKQYLRLTAAPDPSTVRPEPVLQLSLDHVWAKWTANQDYHYVCEQLKSIRQDLTVQGIRNEFTVRVYETHGRVALENGDRGEFNQCQTQLKALYSEGCHGNHAEFLAYRILYLILTNNTADMSTVLLEVPSELRHTPCVDHALKMRSAWALRNYHSFFRLYHTTPNVGMCLLNMFVERERTAALKAMAKAYRPTLAVSFISAELGFASDEECLSFLVNAGAVLDRESTKMDCKLTSSKLSSSG